MSDTAELVKLADELERLCCAETEGKFFDLVTDSIPTILAALRLAAQQDGAWMPIESAPYGKTVILGKAGDKLRVTAYRNGMLSGWRHAHSSDAICFEPTHWRPLPAPPAA